MIVDMLLNISSHGLLRSCRRFIRDLLVWLEFKKIFKISQVQQMVLFRGK